MSKVNLEVPEVKSILRSLVGLPKAIEQISKVVDLTQRELIDSRKLIQHMRFESFKTIQSKIHRLVSTATKFDTDKPQYEIKNPLDKDIKLLSLSITPLPASLPLMHMKITMGNVILFEEEDVALPNFTDTASFNIAIPEDAGKEWRKQTTIKIFLWSAGGNVTCTFVYAFGDYF